jgi:hypothetical protein
VWRAGTTNRIRNDVHGCHQISHFWKTTYSNKSRTTVLRMSSVNADTGETTQGRSPRFTQWVAFLIFSTITLGSSVEVVRFFSVAHDMLCQQLELMVSRQPCLWPGRTSDKTLFSKMKLIVLFFLLFFFSIFVYFITLPSLIKYLVR